MWLYNPFALCSFHKILNNAIKMKYLYIFLATATILFFVACGNKSREEGSVRGADIDSAWVHVTQEQFDAMGMELGNLQDISFTETLKMSGNIVSSVKGQAQITSRISGTIRSISRELGDYAAAGSVLCTVESNDLIELQQSFIDVSTRYKEARSAYERLRSLYSDSITSKRDFIAAESAYRSLTAQYEGTKQRLSLLRVNPANVENGNIQSLLSITAPISGYVTDINCMIGEFVTPEKGLMTLVNVNQLYLQLNVYEKDISHLQIGQAVEFYNPNNLTQKFTAHISKIGKAIDPEKKTIPCIATFDTGLTADFVNNMYVEANVVLAERQGKGISEDALESVGNINRVYLLAKREGNDIYFQPVTVTTGMKSGNYVEIINNLPSQEILTKGVYSLPAVE